MTTPSDFHDFHDITNMSDEEIKDLLVTHNWWFRGQRRIRPDVDIAVVYDADSEIFEARQEPDEIWTAIIASSSNEEVCFYLALCELLDKEFLAEFPPKGKYSEQLGLSVVMYEGGFGGKIARIAWEHDIDDVCLAITNGGLTS